MISQRLTLSQQRKFGDFLFDILEASYQKLGFENPNDTVLDVYNRNKIISLLCRYNHKDCNENATGLLSRIPADFQETFYCVTSRKADFAL